MKLVRWLWRPAPYAMLLLLAAIETAAMIYFCNGKFCYTLDDPYIHLALSKQIAVGHYGLNPGEFSSPSSSILYPFLLAAAAPSPFHEYAPLAINVLAMLLTLAMTLQFFTRLGLASTDRPLRRTLLAVGFIVFTNTFGVVFTGMEHSLQFLFALSIVTGLIVFLEDDRILWRLPAAMILGPLIRYEALALSFAAAAVLAVLRPRQAAALLVLTIAPVAAFSAFLHQLGLPWLPSSVLAKSDFLGLLTHPQERYLFTLQRARVFGVLGVLLLGTQLFKGLRAIPVRMLLGFCAAIGLAHVLFGAYGSLFRYEGYLFLSLVAVAIYCYRDLIAALLRNPNVARLLTLLGLAAVPFGWFVHFPLVVNPLAARNVYEQQYQVHRFAVDFHRGPIGVNDLGRVAYENPYYVLDLFGLGSDAARTARQAQAPDQLASLAKQKNVAVAAIYSSWFENNLPKSWTPLARLSLSGRKIGAAEAAVTFYATDPAFAGDLLRELAAFAPTLPAGVRLEFLPRAPTPSPAAPSSPGVVFI